jgi:uncharacterized protein
MTNQFTDPFTGSTVLITGASSGLGMEFAWQLAPWVKRLILVARRGERLQSLAMQIKAAQPLIESVDVIPADLTREEDRLRLISLVGARVDLLINNAGMGDYGEVTTAQWERCRSMIDLNVTATVHLCHGLIPHMKARGRGAIINVSSLASELMIPDFALYAAAKAAVSRFSEGLRLEVKDHGIRVLALCPGPVPTEFGQKARRPGEEKTTLTYKEALTTTPRRVVREALQALEKGQAICYPGWRVRLLAHVIRVLPRWLVRLIMAQRPRRGSAA